MYMELVYINTLCMFFSESDLCAQIHFYLVYCQPEGMRFCMEVFRLYIEKLVNAQCCSCICKVIFGIQDGVVTRLYYVIPTIFELIVLS